MENKTLTKNVMKKVVTYEKRRVAAWLWLFFGVVGVLTAMGINYLINLGGEINQMDSLSPLRIIFEDFEIVSKYWNSAISTFWEELPKGIMFRASLILSILLVWEILTRKKRKEIENRGKGVIKYEGGSGGSMMKNVVIVLAITVMGTLLLLRMPKRVTPVEKKNNLETNTNGTNNTPTVSQVGETVSKLFLEITSPANGTTVKTSVVELVGKTTLGSEVFVNDIQATVNANGGFRASVNLDEGENYIMVVANDENGEFVEKEITVTYSID